MSQEEVITWLQVHPGWHRTAIIASGISRGRSSVYNSVVALAKHGDIKKRSIGHSAKCGLEWSA